MKKLILGTALAIAVATPALAGDKVNARIEDHYRNVIKKVPHTEQVCKIVEVPVYGRGQASTGDALVGAIIGGAIGNQFGGGSGKDAATVLGAIVGADVANKKGGDGQIVGYRQEERCEYNRTYETFEEEVYSHSTITWYENGRNYTLKFNR